MPIRKKGLVKGGENINIRDRELRARLAAWLAANPGKSLTEIVRDAVNEKLDAIEAGRDHGLKLRPPKSSQREP